MIVSENLSERSIKNYQWNTKVFGIQAVKSQIKKNSKEISDIIERALYGGYTNSRSTFASGRQQADHDLVTFGELLKGEPLNSEEVMSLTDLMEESVFYS